MHTNTYDEVAEECRLKSVDWRRPAVVGEAWRALMREKEIKTFW